MSTEQSAASRTEVGPVETAAVGPDQTAVPTVGAVGERGCHRSALQRVSPDGATLAGAGHAFEDARQLAAVQALRSRTLAYREERIVSVSTFRIAGDRVVCKALLLKRL
jgi:hypothetical protein